MGSRDSQWDWPRLHARCRREARRLLRDPHDADDAAQEALARAWRKRDTCRTPRTPEPWLLQITRNEVFRLQGRRRDEADPRVAEWAGDPSGAAATEDLVATRLDIRRAVSRLTADERVLIHLRYEEDLKQRSIAELLDTPEGTIKVKLYRARQSLRTQLKDEPEGDHTPE